MVRIPINPNKKLSSLVIGNKKELSQFYGKHVLIDLEEFPHNKKLIAKEYEDGQIVYSTV